MSILPKAIFRFSEIFIKIPAFFYPKRKKNPKIHVEPQKKSWKVKAIFSKITKLDISQYLTSNKYRAIVTKIRGTSIKIDVSTNWTEYKAKKQTTFIIDWFLTKVRGIHHNGTISSIQSVEKSRYLHTEEWN
jgi:hypothetical protein